LNFGWIDWSIFIVLFIALNLMGFLCRKLIRGVAHFLVAGRNVGRYLGLGADVMQGTGAITILAMWQMNYDRGFSALWWFMLIPIAAAIVAITGLGVYRIRQSRAMTLGQFVEMRYGGRRFRIFFGVLAYVGGVLNMGIFPAIGAGFFITYCGLPTVFPLAGVQVPTILPVMIVLVGSAVAICLWGGQLTIIVTDFVQGLFVDLVLIAIMFVIYKMFTWDQWAEAFGSAANAQALLHPYQSEDSGEFNTWFFLIFIYLMFYMVISWAPNTIQVSSARDAHEGKMMRLMTQIKSIAMIGLGLSILPLAAFVLMNHPDFAAQADSVNAVLAEIPNEEVRSQMITPAALVHILPKGLLGALAGVILFSFISTHTSYLLAWGGMLIQDVVLPLRKGKPLDPQGHMRWLKVSVVFVAVFIIAFSFFYKQNDKIYMFQTLSSAVFMAAAGVVLLGGLYWSKATSLAAWVTMISGAILSSMGFIYRGFVDENFLNGRIIMFWVSVICIALYILVSLLDKRPPVNLDKILNRNEAPPEQKSKGFRFLQTVPKKDHALIIFSIVLMALFMIAFIGLWIVSSWQDLSIPFWLSFWKAFIIIMFATGSLCLIWVSILGIRDLVRLFKDLKAQDIDVQDDGSVPDDRTERVVSNPTEDL
jgi:SSS family solute:Na+ symporter